MLITPYGSKLSIRQPVALTRTDTQTLVDAEVRFVAMGLELHLWCKRCRQAGDDFVCVAGYDVLQHRFTVDCGCRNRTYVGTDIVMPPAPGPVATARLDLEPKPEHPLTRGAMRAIADFEQCCEHLDLQYALRCLACRLADAPTDGIWGLGDTTDTQFVLECACRKRIYRNADAPVATP